MTDTVLANTAPGEKGLVVAHKALIANGYLPNEDKLDENAFDLEGRRVAFINWGYGIGSNRWKDATSVFLFGEFHIPKRASVATALGLVNQPAGKIRLGSIQSPNSHDAVLLAIQHGHLLRWEKQLAMRGSARVITAVGICGFQRLFVTAEFKRFTQYRETLFPGATFLTDSSLQVATKAKGGAQAVAALLLSCDEDRLTTAEIKERTGVDCTKNSSRLRSDALVKEAMSLALCARPWSRKSQSI